MMQISAADGVAEAYVARPQQQDGPVPGILYFFDLSGLRDLVRENADRMASWGYVVLVPNLFYRDGDVAATTPPGGGFATPQDRESFVKAGMERIGNLTPERSHADIPHWLDALTGLDGVATGGVGTVGYCMGVRHALRAAGRHPERVKAVAGIHGGLLVTDDPQSPHRVVAGAKARFTFGHAHQDDTNTPEQIATLDAVLDERGLSHHTEVVAAKHGYSMPDNPNYVPAAQKHHFDLVRQLFDATLR